MGIFNEFFKKEKPVFTGSRFGFGLGPSGPTAPPPTSITGGTTTAAGITPGNGYRYHVFMQSGSPQSFVIPETRGPVTCDFLIIGGGGSGGYDVGGGGGAGGMVHGENYPFPTGTHPVTVGAGGIQCSDSPFLNKGNSNLNGNNSVLFISGGTTITGNGGGGGGGWVNPAPGSIRPGAPGGNGGGAAGYLAAESGGTGNQNSANPGVSNITQYGDYNGGATDSPSGPQKGGGGGGTNGNGRLGAGSPAGAGGDAKNIPSFGAPLISPEIPAPTRTSWSTTVGPSGYYGYGGYGASDGDSNPQNPGPRAAINGTGNGGAGSGSPNDGGDRGADGIIIIRYSV